MAAAMRLSKHSFLPRLRLYTNAALTSHAPSSCPEIPPSPSAKPISLLKSALRSESDPDKILDLFQSSSHLPKFYSNRHLYKLSINKLSRLRRLDLVELLLESQKSDPAAPKSEGFFIRIMSLYTRASMPDHALQTFKQIPAPSRTDKSLCSLLNAYLEQRRFDCVRDLFHRIPGEFGIVPGVSSHNVLLTSFCETGEMDAACKVLDEMAVKGLEPNIISYNTLLTWYLKKDDKVRFRDTLKEVDSKEIGPNVVTYNLRMLDFCKRLESFKAEELLDEVISKGIQPNLSTFNTIIDGFCKEGNLESAVRVFKRLNAMKRAKGKERFSPNADTYVVLIRGLVDNGNFASAQNICSECLIRNYSPPFEIMKTLINGLVKNSMVTEAKDLVDKMRKVAKGTAVESWTKLEAELTL